MRSNALPLLFTAPIALAVLACDAPVVEREGHRGHASSIINGTASSNPDDDAVTLLWLGNGFCTGTLIAPNLLLTARHCVSEPGAGQAECEPFGADKAPSSMTVSLGEHPSSQSPVARGARLFVEPTSTVCGQDIALILLDQSVPGVKPKQVRLTAPTAGELTTAIGYGQDESEQTTGRKIRTNIPVEAVGPASRTATANGQTVGVQVPANDFMTGESVCHGDSGGPLFDAKGLVLGTTSRGTSLGCVGTPAIFSSTAAHATLIKTALAAAGHPLGGTGSPADAGAGADAAAPAAPAPPAAPSPDAGSGDGGVAEPSAGTSEASEEGTDGEAPKSDKGSKGKKNDDSDDDDDDDVEDDNDNGSSSKSTRPSPTYFAAPDPAPSSGCSATPRSVGLDGASLAPLALALVVLRRRRALSR
ncbi:MAG: trypsin-like serine protease [Labilithrix sp.]